ncbi:TIGR01777 family protein [Duganella sp. BJB488]|uniref:TIGR01777 family oxidoreductase n=1 Tax=unclassified Duganella TaxID=2636909 RepID=UPI000E34E772|nr:MULTISPECIES: TIGR01777 family oxidoreductase [unclassified Duganella]RFP14162.1 TIGR01777 family protein [Duganella sp. BJB489]RFP17255.1 TIGR01777 family protein [Duganella sp. BJB488]RFP31955.1 TIGR01777 family protein [Duganella sp. BJB480]
MNTHLIALQLMAAQGCLGAFDTLYHHELTEALPGRATARRELSIHAVRALIYSALFIGLAGWAFHGAWALVLLAVFSVEIVLTLWDFVVEDRTRLLPATERVTHTVLAMNGGAFIALLALNTPAWWAMPTALAWQPQGALSVFLALCGVGVGLSGVRDAFAARAIGKLALRDGAAPEPGFGAPERSFLVTGATGFIGQRLVRALLRDGHRVTVLTRQVRQAAWLFDGRVDCVDSMAQLPASRRIDVVINLAGARILGWRWTAARRAALRASRVALTNNLEAWIAAAEHKPAQLISASAIGYYGTQRRGDDTVLTENDGPQPMFMSDLCREWEQAAQGAAAHGVRVACTRFGLVLGTQGALPMMLLPIKLGLGGPLGGGTQWLSWIHVDDVIGGIAHLCSSGEEGVFNFTAPESLTQARFNRVAAAVLHRPYGFPTPGWPMRLMLGEQADLLLEGQRVAPARLLACGYAFRHPQLEGALRSLA